MMTPYEKLKSLPDAIQYLKPEITFQILDEFALKISDNAKCQPTCRILVIPNLLCTFMGALPPNPQGIYTTVMI